MKRILFADNDKRFLETRAGFLREAGYEVLLARSPEEAEQLLSEEHVHLAILDIRLEEDLDERDVSGLVLARAKEYRRLPKIIMTKYPTYENVREALGETLDGLPPAVRFIAKQEGGQALVRAVDEAFNQHVRINWNLSIQTGESSPLTFHRLLDLIDEQSEQRALKSRTGELEDLFRDLFFDMNQIRIGRLLWTRDSRAAVTVFAFAEGKRPESFVVVYGGSAGVEDEARHYHDYAPKAPGLTSTVLYRSSETTHYAANAYVLASADLENLRSFADLYRTGPERQFRSALENLFQTTLAAWHQNVSDADESRSLGQWYFDALGLTGIDESSFEERVQYIIHLLPALGLEVESDSSLLNLRYGGRTLSYADPTKLLTNLMRINEQVLLENVPGSLDGQSILTDSEGRVWLTDFADAGLGPVNANVVALEAAMRFDWVESNRIVWLLDMEKSLVEAGFGRLDPGDVEPPLRKTVRSIQLLRRAAMRPVTSNINAHHFGILCEAAKRLADLNISYELTQNERARLGHILLASAMIYDKIASSARMKERSAAPDQGGIKVDKDSLAVWVGGTRIPIRGQSFDLLCYLYDRANQLCKRRELIENVFEEPYRERDESQVSKLNTAIRRLREKIEFDPDHPRYVLTEPGGGYRLVV
ncbi:MAG TPA: DNA-binding response regulator [Blastocatellia bacterium]|nr:DNA-binding response regulator [Blastocatellia bacterium]